MHLLVSGRPGEGEPSTGGEESAAMGATDGLSDPKSLLLLLFSSFALLLSPSFAPPLPLPLPLPDLLPFPSPALLFFIVNLGMSSLNVGGGAGALVLASFLGAFLLFSLSLAFLLPW